MFLRNVRLISLNSRRLFRTMSTVKGKPEDAKIVEARHVKETSDCKWIGLQKIIYKDPNGKEREWDSAVRTTRSSGGVDGIGILTILKYKDGKPDEILLQKQFRPPVEGVCIEMPAGLIDAGEDIDTAALRELKEETGYSGKIISKSPTVFNDPGFTNTNLCLVTVEVDMSLPENQKPVTQLEDNEFIECFSVELHKFPDEMVKLDQQGYKLDARVQNVAQGILMAKQYHIK
ncbi:Ysa1p [Saccharomyces cerevisiae YJM1307]|nr:Ysa1p [Saccharomyces cerevisiae YJM1307]